jgi:heme A synthase
VPTSRLTRFAWFVLAYSVAVVLFGAVVRATGSGAGCGSNWPTCRGEVLPLSGAAETAIEFTHRTTSGLAVLFVIGLVAWVWRVRPAGDPARRFAAAAGGLIIVEALIGAALVLFGWVGDDASTGRAVSISVHLVNTFLLLAALALTAWTLSGGVLPKRPLPPGRRRLVGIAAGGLIVTGAAGAITALGDTLFPAENVLSGIRDDFTGTFLVRLRWIHPIVAIATGAVLVFMARTSSVAGGAGRRLATVLEGLVFVQVAAGFVNVALLAPVWMQVLHLLLADAMWVVFVLYSQEVLAAPSQHPAPAVAA